MDVLLNHQKEIENKNKKKKRGRFQCRVHR